MRSRFIAFFAAALLCSAVTAQPPGTRMYPGTDFPGNDLVNMPVASPEECAAHCAADGRCTAFTFAIPNRQCYLKWAPSRFDGSLTAISGVIEGRPITPPGSGAPPGGANTNTCSTPDRFGCKGCSAACGPNESPICTPSIPGEGDSCHSQAYCRRQPK